jgi:hypothetical protein
VQMVALERLVGGQQPQRNRQVKRRTLLAGVRGSEIYRKPAIGKFVARVLDRGLDPIQGLLRGALGQTHGPEAWHAAGDIDFDFDRERVNPGERA